MRVVDLIKNESQTIKWVRDEFNKGNLIVDNGFQRRYVWLRKHQISLIETILMGYVIPEIYIWVIDTDANTGDTKYSIVDGQQRIGAIVDYINGRFPLSKAYLKDSSATYVGKKFNDLSSEDKEKIWEYSLSIRRILKDVSREDIVNLFLRLNLTDKSLNPQELRNAEYDGLFLQTALEIADWEFWQKYKIFGTDSLRRMGDVEFISSILLFLRKGVDSEITQEGINQAYDLYNETYDESEDDKNSVAKILNNIEKIVDSNRSIITFIKKTSHLYTIFVVVYKCLLDEDTLSEEEIDNINDFYSKYERSTEEIAVKYSNFLASGTRSKANRIGRINILSDIASGKIKLN